MSGFEARRHLQGTRPAIVPALRYPIPARRGPPGTAPPVTTDATHCGYLLHIIGSGNCLRSKSRRQRSNAVQPFTPGLLHRAAPEWLRSRPGSNGCRSPPHACMAAITYIEAQGPARSNAAARGVLQCTLEKWKRLSSALGHGGLGGTSRSTSPDPGQLRASRTTTPLLAKNGPGPRAQQMNSVSQVKRALRRNTTSPICAGMSGGIDEGGV